MLMSRHLRRRELREIVLAQGREHAGRQALIVRDDVAHVCVTSCVSFAWSSTQRNSRQYKSHTSCGTEGVEQRGGHDTRH